MPKVTEQKPAVEVLEVAGANQVEVQDLQNKVAIYERDFPRLNQTISELRGGNQRLQDTVAVMGKRITSLLNESLTNEATILSLTRQIELLSRQSSERLN